MKKLTTLISGMLCCFLLILSVAALQAQSIDLKIMSYNMQQPYGTNWDGRKANAASIINNYQGDIVGTQELVNYQRDYIMANTSGYSFYGSGRDCGDNGEGSWILYKNAKFSLDASNSGNFWFSDNPNVCGRGWDPNYNRICTYVRLIERATGKAFYIYNVHFPTPDLPTARTKSVQLLCSRAASRAFPNDPVIFTGDFNSLETESQIQYIKSGATNPSKMRDSYRDIYPTGNVTTGFGVKFDYIFIENKSNVSVLSTYVVNNPVASDHLPIVATIRLSSTTPPPPATITIPGKAEAENYRSMSGIQTENTTDTGGGVNVGWIDAGDWMDYSVNVQTAGTYTVEYRVASTSTTGQIQLRNGATNLATSTVPNTGGWQNWQTITTSISLSAGAQTLRVYASGGGFNLNWINFRSTNIGFPIPGKIEAEAYGGMAGVQTESTTDAGAGLNVGWIDAGDWMDYTVNVRTAGTYTLEYRIASTANTGQLQLKRGSSTLVTTTLPNTGGWQSWRTVTTSVTLNAGVQSLRLQAGGPGFNINWMNFILTMPATSRLVDSNGNGAEKLMLFMDEANEFVTIKGIENAEFTFYNLNGNLLLKSKENTINISSLNQGIYIVKAANQDRIVVKRLVKR